MRERDEEDDCADSDDESPQPDDTKLELESVSDSSDWHHEGNGVPCKFYNHDGCLRGTNCRFSHAPDHKSVRDRLYVL
jgi:L,D-peptidoglycan transpeptidase YkuD (ErfK/YbiS/YcfS/YnhG family)